MAAILDFQVASLTELLSTPLGTTMLNIVFVSQFKSFFLFVICTTIGPLGERSLGGGGALITEGSVGASQQVLVNER